jgi:hypothetical protein
MDAIRATAHFSTKTRVRRSWCRKNIDESNSIRLLFSSRMLCSNVIAAIPPALECSYSFFLT